MNNVLFDAPGPRTQARHRLYAVVASAALAGLAALAVWRMWDTGQLAYEQWEPLATPVYIGALLEGLLQTLAMAFLSILFAVVFGLVFGVGKMSDQAWLRWPSWVVVEFFRAVPLLLLIIFLFFTFGVGVGGIGSFWSVVIGLTLYNGSVLAEVFRAGVNAVPRGQSEAAYAIGMRKSQVMNLVLLPQAVKIMLPAIISQCVVALKDTSLGFYILAPGLTAVGRGIWIQFGNQFQVVIVVSALYIAANLVLTWVATRVQHKFVGEKKPLEVTTVGGPASGANEGGI